MRFGSTIELGLIALALGAVCGSGQAQQAVQLTVHPIKEGRLYWVEGGGGNSGVIIGKTGVIVIDTKTTADGGRQLLAEIAKLTAKPVTHVIETHSDGDHVNGLAGFPAGLTIIAHVNNKNEQQAVFQYAAVETGGGRCLPPADHLPNALIFNDKVRTLIDGERVEFHYFGPAHTSGDLVVYLPEEKLAFAGDLITSNVLVHPEKSGSFAGWFRDAAGLLSLGADHYLGGHAQDLDTKASLRARIEAHRAVRDQVDDLVKDGKSLSEIKVALHDPPKDPSGCRGIPYQSLAEVEYHERVNRNQELK